MVSNQVKQNTTCSAAATCLSLEISDIDTMDILPIQQINKEVEQRIGSIRTKPVFRVSNHILHRRYLEA